MLNPMMADEVAVKGIPRQKFSGYKQIFAFTEVSRARHNGGGIMLFLSRRQPALCARGPSYAACLREASFFFRMRSWWHSASVSGLSINTAVAGRFTLRRHQASCGGSL